MNKEMKNLLYLFMNIRQKGYIKNLKKFKNGSSYTFEKLIKKEGDNCPFPDFNGIEIKTKHQFSHYRLHLICIEPDKMFDTYKLTQEYGYKPKEKNIKYFSIEINALTKSRYINHYFKIYIDDEKEQLILQIFNKEGNLISEDITWSYENIKIRLQIKLNTLALILYQIKTIDKEEYYYYKHLQYYQNINFDKFITAIKQGIITIQFNINIDTKTDKIKNHGTCFSIDTKSISKIYNHKF